MSNSFVGTPVRAFKQSPCRARVTKQPGFFDWQIINAARSSVDFPGSGPIGYPQGGYDGPNGPYVPWGDYSIPDPRNATFAVPSASQLKQDGYMHEGWESIAVNWALGIYFGFPNPRLFRVGTRDHPRLHRSSSPLGIFNQESIDSGFKVRRGVLILGKGNTYNDVTSDHGVAFKAGVAIDQWQQLKLYDRIGGTITKHTLVIKAPAFSSVFWNTFFTPHFSDVLPPPHHVEEWFPAHGDPPRILKPDEFVYGNYSVGPNFPYPDTINALGTVEILVFWFYLHQDQLPSFPLPFNTAKDFFFVSDQ